MAEMSAGAELFYIGYKFAMFMAILRLSQGMLGLAAAAIFGVGDEEEDE